MIFHNKYGGRRVKKQKLKSQLLLVNFYFVLAQFHIRRARFSLVFPTYVLFCTEMLVLYCFDTFKQPNVFSSPEKVRSHDQKQPVKRFPGHQQ